MKEIRIIYGGHKGEQQGIVCVWGAGVTRMGDGNV